MSDFDNMEESMSNSVKLKDLYVGIPDGATEAQNEKFQELFFDPNNKYEELMKNDEKFLIIGSKGTGKTYLANYVLKKSPKTQTAELVDSSDFRIHKLSNVRNIKDLNEDIVYALCKWFLLNELSHTYLERHKKMKYIPLTGPYKIRKFVERYENLNIFKEVKKVEINSKEKNVSNEKDISNNCSKSAVTNRFRNGFSLSNGITVEFERKDFFELIKAYENKLFNSFSRCDDILLILDDLDEIEDGEDGLGTVLVKLINIAKEYNSKLKKEKKKVKLILLLRSDILDGLQIRNANLSKIKTSCSVELYWLSNSMQEQYNHPLMSMVLHKIKTACPQFVGWSNKKLFSELFPENIDNKRPLDYLLDHGFGRPRDIATYLNHAKNEFPNESFFSALVLKGTRKFYSSDFYDEILNQASFYKKPEYVRQCMNLLSAVKRSSFNYSIIKEIYEKDIDRYDAIDDVDNAISFLYETGAIGNVWKFNGKVHTSWSYKKDAMKEVDFSKKFTIHYGLRKKFSL